ncbi:MAG: gamma-glutamyl-gamma-aminobutyrate hydrolase family protein [Bacteroidales bacterium]|nr:gamma-glutamyl-gamma-aminobutyrate hydrolase family protein [Bacteroidales bacterium]
MKKVYLLLAMAMLVAVSCSHKPVIGISASHGNTASSSSGGDSYVESVRRAGGIPLILPFTTDSLAICEMLDHIDGLIMTGGEDVNPARYGHDTIPELGTVNDRRDTFDLCLVRNAVRRGIPVLGICRGEQVTNVALGGTLWQDIPAQVDTMLVHRQPESASVKTQTIYISEGSRLREIIGCDSLLTNSKHHQAVRDIAPSLKVTAVAADGVVEAYESVANDLVLGIQSHPEAFARDGEEPYLSIFRDLVKRSR